MKTTYRIPHPKDQYAFVEVVIEDTDPVRPETLRDMYDSLKNAFVDGEGLGMKKFAEVLHEYCTTGKISNGGEHDFSEKERLLLNEVKKIIRKDKNN